MSIDELLPYTAGGMPCDVTLKLQCEAELPSVSYLLQVASPFFRNILEDVKGSNQIPVRKSRIASVCGVRSEDHSCVN